MIQTFGNFIEKPEDSEGYLVIGFSPNSIPIRQRWRNNGLSADFLADYIVSFFPKTKDYPSNIEKRTEIKGIVSYVANELMENAMKFSDPESSFPISIQLQLYDDNIEFFVTNSVLKYSVAEFQDYIQKILSSDTQELYINQLEHNAENENNDDSGLGLLTMINDYMAKIGWKFEITNQKTIVTTTVQLSI
ncbi:ATP-binding protein [Candidatus Halobeggiatoa sp. HSG11]|nr:ATP-binding protein [Candidatus Halobeggiatoa sp. HSG11]